MQDPTSAFLRMKKAVERTATTTGQVNEVVRTLAAHGYRKADDPHVEEAYFEKGAKMQFFVWDDTPFGDDVVLATGPSFKPRVALGSQIKPAPGVGIYVQSMIAKLKTGVRASMGRAAGHAEVIEERVKRREVAPSYRDTHRPSSRGGLGVPTSAVQRGREIGETRRAAQREEEARAQRIAERDAETRRREARAAAGAKAAERAAAAQAQKQADAAMKKAEAAAAAIDEKGDDDAADRELAAFADMLAKKLGLK
jgi:hypothetical protein